MNNQTNAINNLTKATPNRFDPRTWSRGKQLTAGLLVATLAVGGWAIFRPERIFINNTVSESFPIASTAGQSAPVLLSEGGFTSLGHHTEGKASIYKSSKGHVLRLSDFKTSNGPDVRVYLVKGASGTDNAAIKNGDILDLGVIKGNIGDQNYQLPTDFDPTQYGGVSIWCKRFGVNFAGAPLTSQDGQTLQTSAPQAAAMAPAPQEMGVKTKAVVVTTGQFHQISHATKGTATITEDGKGKRTLTLKGFQTSMGPKLRLYLFAAENVKTNAESKKLVNGKQFVDLGALKSIQGEQSYTVPDNIDLWKFLSVGVWCDKFDVNFGTAPLSAPTS